MIDTEKYLLEAREDMIAQEWYERTGSTDPDGYAKAKSRALKKQWKMIMARHAEREDRC